MDTLSFFVMFGLLVNFTILEHSKTGKISWVKIILTLFITSIFGILYYFLGYWDIESGVLGIFATTLAWNHKWLREDKEKAIRIGWYGMFIIGFLLFGLSLLDALMGLV